MAPIRLDPEKQIRNVRHHEDSPLQDPNNFLSNRAIHAMNAFRTKVEFSVNFHNDDWETYEITKIVGYGASGAVYEARRMSTSASDGSSQRVLAIKFLTSGRKVGTLSEIDVLCKIPKSCYDMKNIVRYRAFIPATEVFGTLDRRGVIFMDMATNGCLIDWVTRRHRSNNRYHFPEHVAKRIVLDLISSLGTLRNNGVSHRDVKCDNIFIDSQGRFLLGDFGHVRIVKGDCKSDGSIMKIRSSAHERVGTNAYNPPELLQDSIMYDSEKVDVFQLGYTLLILLTGHDLFGIGGNGNDKSRKPQCVVFTREMVDPKYRKKTSFWEMWDNVRTYHTWMRLKNQGQEGNAISSSCRKLLSAMLSYNPDDRPTFAQLLRARNSEDDDSSLDTLKWLSPTGDSDVCSLEELYDELYERIADDNGRELKNFWNIRRPLENSLRKISVVNAFKRAGRNHAETSGEIKDIIACDVSHNTEMKEVNGGDIYPDGKKKRKRKSSIVDGSQVAPDALNADKSSWENEASDVISDMACPSDGDEEAERDMFILGSEQWGDTSVRPSMRWEIQLKDSSAEGIQTFLATLEQKLRKQHHGLEVSKERNIFQECWSINCSCENEHYDFNASLIRSDAYEKELGRGEVPHGADLAGDGNSFVLDVRRNYGNSMRIQSMLSEIFDSQQLEQMWGESFPVYRPSLVSKHSRTRSREVSDDNCNGDIEAMRTINGDYSGSSSGSSSSCEKNRNTNGEGTSLWAPLRRYFGFGS